MAHIGTTAVQLLNKVQWRLLIEGATNVVNTALTLSDRLDARNKERQRSRPDGQADTLSALGTEVTQIRERLDTTEGAARQQAELISRMAAQEEAILRGVENLSHRVTILNWALAGTIVLAAVALLGALLLPR